jgi:NitT/TauT family transport system ATP-binding protein
VSLTQAGLAATTNGYKLRAKQLGMVYHADGNSVAALEDINLDIANGEFISIVGPSGCGKSTLLNVMGGFLSPSTGAVMIDGEAVTGPDQRRILVFQERGVFPWLTVSKATSASGYRNSPAQNARAASPTMCSWSACKGSSIPIRRTYREE